MRGYLISQYLLLVLAQKVNFFDDIKECLGTACFISDCFGSFVSWSNESAIICASEEKKVSIKFLISRYV